MTPRNAALAMLLADLRDELLAAPCEPTVEAHVNMMRFEQQVVAPVARTSEQAVRTPVNVRVRRAAASRPRRVAAVIAAVCALSGALSLDAANALPSTIRHLTNHITNTIVHTFGVPQAPQPDESSQSGSGNLSSSARRLASGAARDVALGVKPGGSSSTGTTAPGAAEQTKGSSPSPTTDRPRPVAGHGQRPTPPWSPTPPPPKKNMGKDPRTPPGFPANWRSIAISDARTQLEVCAQANALTPTACPQQADSISTPDTVQWTLLNQPLADAVAVAQTPPANAGPDSPGTEVDVYGLFQMDATYTANGDATHTYFAYSGGMAEAMMAWNGSTFETVSFVSGSVGLPAGIYVPWFIRPASVPNTSALTAVQAGFAACAASAPLPDASLPNCPQSASIDPTATGAQWSLVGDPSHGAVVSFDTQHGDFAVSGTYAMTLTVTDADGTTSSESVTGAYTATLSFDGQNLRLLAIAGT